VTPFFFYLYAIIAIVGALGLVLARNLIHAVMSLFATLVSIAALFLLLGSQFLAAMQLFVYGGAITVLVLFVLMLTGPQPEAGGHSKEGIRLLSVALCLVFFGAIAAIIAQTKWQISPSTLHDTASIATILFSRYVLPFEIAGLSLTIALIGAVVLAREDDVMDAPVPEPLPEEPAETFEASAEAGEPA
jgi:NADH-quinone oxidoreductase subunit J